MCIPVEEEKRIAFCIAINGSMDGMAESAANVKSVDVSYGYL